MKASDIMVCNVVTVGPDVSIREVARILLANRISAVPVVDSRGGLLGIVSEGDMLRRPESGTVKKHSWVAQLTCKSLAAEYVKSHSRKVADVMTRRVITATMDTSLDEIVNLLEKNRIKRLPIVAGGKIVGIVSRANFLQILANSATKTAAHLRDSQIRKQVIARLSAKSWRPTMLDVKVRRGVVDLWGLIHSEDDRRAARITAELTPGVKSVKDNLMIPPTITGLV